MGIPQSRSPSTIASYIIHVIDKAANTPYIGEPMSQTEHSLQCGALASSSVPAADEQTQVAALLHDIGQYAPIADIRQALTNEFSGVENMGNVGRHGHETIGARFLLSLGFPEKVARLVESHVASKRYLCAVDPAYHSHLSEASQKSLVYQGGPMNREEKEAFESSPWCQDMCRLRKWDDAAKVVDLEVPSLESWRDIIERVLGEPSTNL